MDIFEQYAVDPKIELEGKWFDFGDAKLLIARSGNPAYQRMLNKLWEAHKHTLEQKETPEQLAAAKDRSNKIMAEVMSHTVLLGWAGNFTFQKQPLAYSIANAKKVLLIEEFQKAVAKLADDFKNYRFEVEEADAKNSTPTSGGNSPGAASLTSSEA